MNSFRPFKIALKLLFYLMEIPDFMDLKKQNKTSALKIEEIQKLRPFQK